jgi:hypothetical protein
MSGRFFRVLGTAASAPIADIPIAPDDLREGSPIVETEHASRGIDRCPERL